MKCDKCGTSYKSYYPDFRECEKQCNCEQFDPTNPEHIQIADEYEFNMVINACNNQSERLNETDHFPDVKKMVCDSLNTTNK